MIQTTTMSLHSATVRLPVKTVHPEFLLFGSSHSLWLDVSPVFQCASLPAAFAASALGKQEACVRHIRILGKIGIRPSWYKIWLHFHCLLDLMSAVFR